MIIFHHLSLNIYRGVGVGVEEAAEREPSAAPYLPRLPECKDMRPQAGLRTRPGAVLQTRSRSVCQPRERVLHARPFPGCSAALLENGCSGLYNFRTPKDCFLKRNNF